MEINTHNKINHELCGSIERFTENGCIISLILKDQMKVHDFGLVHGGFIFGLADYAAMVVVNDPNVVLGSAIVKFLKPVKVGMHVQANAEKIEEKGKKTTISVKIIEKNTPEKTIFEGTFVCFTLEQHVFQK